MEQNSQRPGLGRLGKRPARGIDEVTLPALELQGEQ